MITNKDLLKLIARKRKLTFISTGMSEIEDIKYAVKINIYKSRDLL